MTRRNRCGATEKHQDITQGLTRVEELFEARNPRSAAQLCDIAGTVKVNHQGGKTTVTVHEEEPGEDSYHLQAGFEVVVEKGDKVAERTIMAKSRFDKSVIRAIAAGQITQIDGGVIVVKHYDLEERAYQFGGRESLIVKNGSKVAVGDPLNVGHFNLQDLLEKKGVYAVQNYVVQEVQHIYASQGQTINDKHLEIIVRKMFSKIRVSDAGDTNFLPGEVADKGEVDYENEKNDKDAKGKGKAATYEQLLLGITRVALATDSWLSGASFQETIRVLVDAATTRKIDMLKGLKENVIIGRLIPTGEVYRKRFAEEEEARIAEEQN